MAWRPAASCRTLFDVQRSGDVGSPDAEGSTRPSRSLSSVGSLASVRFRPPPGRRTRSAGALARVLNSLRPRVIVEYPMPVARATPAMPPRPSARASVAAHSRRARSVSAGANARYFARQSRTSTQ